MRIEDTFNLKINALAVAVVAVVFAKVAIPFLPTLLSYLNGFIGAIPAALKGLWDVIKNPSLVPNYS